MSDRARAGQSFEVLVAASPTLLVSARVERKDLLIVNNTLIAGRWGFTSDTVVMPIGAGDAVAVDSYIGEIYAELDSDTGNFAVAGVG